jgi:hypothetical protein
MRIGDAPMEIEGAVFFRIFIFCAVFERHYINVAGNRWGCVIPSLKWWRCPPLAHLDVRDPAHHTADLGLKFTPFVARFVD